MPENESIQQELHELCCVIRVLPCPLCGSQAQPLNGSSPNLVISYILYSHHTDKVRIACPHCLDKCIRKANVLTAVFGWWGFVLGPFLTIQALLMNRTIAKYHHSPEPNIHLIGFVLIKREELRLIKNKPEAVCKLLAEVNEVG